MQHRATRRHESATRSMAKRFEGKVVVITGGSSGIGLTTALRCGQEGAKLVLSGRSQDKLDKAVASVKEQTGADVVGISADVSTAAGTEGLVQDCLKHFGKIDAVNLNAGAGPHTVEQALPVSCAAAPLRHLAAITCISFLSCCQQHSSSRGVALPLQQFLVAGGRGRPAHKAFPCATFTLSTAAAHRLARTPRHSHDTTRAAGMAKDCKVCDFDEATFDKLFNTNCKSVAFGLKYFINAMKEGGIKGNVLVTSSVSGQQARSKLAGDSLLASSKAAVDMLAKYAAIESADAGAHARSALPCCTATCLGLWPQTCAPRLPRL